MEMKEMNYYIILLGILAALSDCAGTRDDALGGRGESIPRIHPHCHQFHPTGPAMKWLIQGTVIQIGGHGGRSNRSRPF